MAAEVLAQGGARVTVYDAMPSAGRKFLMAGRGGLNLTHSEPLPEFMARYREAAPMLQAAIAAFSPDGAPRLERGAGRADFRRQQRARVSKGVQGLALAARLAAAARCRAVYASRFVIAGPAGTAKGGCYFAHADGAAADRSQGHGARARRRKLAAAGLRRRLGRYPCRPKALRISKLRPANSGFTVAWSDVFRDRFEGQPLKGVALTIGAHTVRGEAMITRSGIEGGAIYALSAELREAVLGLGQATLTIALRPELDVAALTTRLSGTRGKQSLANFLRKAAQLSPVGIGLMQEAAIASGRPLASFSPAELAKLINAIPVQLTGVAPIERAISTAGGVTFDELDERLMLRKLPGVFAAGEMLDWEAPTGGYLLQASFATGAAAGRGVLRWLASS